MSGTGDATDGSDEMSGAAGPPAASIEFALLAGTSYAEIGARPPKQRNALSRVFRAALPFLIIAALWQTASFFSKPYLFPGIGAIGRSFDMIEVAGVLHHMRFRRLSCGI